MYPGSFTLPKAKWGQLNGKILQVLKNSLQQAPSFRSLLAYLETTSWKIYFLGIKILFFRIESWHFQHPFETEFLKTSQNFSPFRKLLISFFLWVVWLSWNFVSQRSFLNRYWKFQLSILKKKVLFLRIHQNKKTLFTDPIFSEGFGWKHRFLSSCKQGNNKYPKTFY